MAAKPAQKQHRVIVEGFTPLRNKQREYRNDKTGQVISKRQYQKLQAMQSLGLSAPVSNEKAAKLREEKGRAKAGDGWIFASGRTKMARYNSLVDSYKSKQFEIGEENLIKKIKAGEATESDLKKFRKAGKDQFKVRGNSESAQRFKQLQKDLKSKDNSPTGKKAQALIQLGRREPEFRGLVGESPK